jgi:trk system potassium uptake protein TrkA
MKKRVQVGIIGLGTFGSVCGRRLLELGHDVVGLDNDEDAVRRMQEEFTQVYQGDGTDKSVLEQLGFADLDHIVVSAGESMEASVLISLHLKELECENVWVKAVSWDHEKILRKVGADQVFFPERYAAQQLALSLTVPGLVEYMPLAGGIYVREITVDNWAGKTLSELDLINEKRILVVAVKEPEEKDYTYFPKGETVLKKGDTIVAFALPESEEIEP